MPWTLLQAHLPPPSTGDLLKKAKLLLGPLESGLHSLEFRPLLTLYAGSPPFSRNEIGGKVLNLEMASWWAMWPDCMTREQWSVYSV